MSLTGWLRDARLARAVKVAQRESADLLEIAQRRIDELQDQNASLREELEAERVKLRISQLEVEHLLAIVERDRERVMAEARTATVGKDQS